MAKAKQGAAAAKAAAARSEKQHKPRKLRFKGLELELPRELNGEVLFDVVELEASENNALPLLRMLRTIVGAEQFGQIRNRIGVSEDLGELLREVFAAYGITMGESSASPDS